jgi:hypothetical protein
VTDQDRPVHTPDVEVVPSAEHDPPLEDTQYTGAHDPGDREWTHDPLERSFFGTVGRGYLIGIIVFGLFAFLLARTQAPDWGFGAAIGAGAFVAFFAGVLGGVVLIGLWAMKNEELIRGNETGDADSPGWVVDMSDDDHAPDQHATQAITEATVEATAEPAEAAEGPAPAEAEAPLPEQAEATEAQRPAAAADSPSEGSITS